MLSYKLHQVLQDIVEEAFPGNQFSRFFIEAIPKEMRTIHGRYYPAFRKIQIFNLSRPTGHIISTSIHEVAHHVDHNLRSRSDHSKIFYKVMYQLLIKALGMGILMKDDILSASDSYDQQRLTRYFGDISKWQVPNVSYKKNIVTVKVKNCYSIKDTLKQHGYKYSSVEQTWEKTLDESQLMSERNFLRGLISENNVTIEAGNNFSIHAIYYICVLSPEKNFEILTLKGYKYNGYNMNNNLWNKKILAQNLDKEVILLKEIPGIKMKIVGSDRK